MAPEETRITRFRFFQIRQDPGQLVYLLQIKPAVRVCQRACPHLGDDSLRLLKDHPFLDGKILFREALKARPIPGFIS